MQCTSPTRFSLAIAPSTKTSPTLIWETEAEPSSATSPASSLSVTCTNQTTPLHVGVLFELSILSIPLFLTITGLKTTPTTLVVQFLLTIPGPLMMVCFFSHPLFTTMLLGFWTLTQVPRRVKVAPSLC